MKSWNRISFRLRALFRKDQLDAEMAEEMRAHLDRRAESYRKEGVSPDEARHAAQRQFGHLDTIAETARDQRGWIWMEAFIRDLRFAGRMIMSHPWFSAAIVVTLAVGIGINTTVFTIVNAVLFKSIPVPSGTQLVTVSNKNPSSGNGWLYVSYPDFQAFREENHSLTGLEAATAEESTISERDVPPERLHVARISPGLADMLQLHPLLGRGFSTHDELRGADPVALIGFDVWQKRYAGAADILGRTVRIDGLPATIVGVMPMDFKFPNNEDIWTPLVRTPELEARSNRPLQLFGMLKPGVSIESARADLAGIATRLAKAYPDTNRNLWTSVVSFHDRYNSGTERSIFLASLGAVGFVLLIACANVANLMLSRAVSRSREFSIRAALGASRWQLIRQMLVESVLLSILGGFIGLGLASAGVHAFDVATRDVGKPYWIVFEMDYVVFIYFAVISVLSGVLFGLVPALRASRFDLNSALKEDTPVAGSRHGGRLSGALVIFQFALTVVLLAGAGMMIRSVFAAQAMNAFVPAGEILTARIQLPEDKGERYEEHAKRMQFHEKLLPLLAALPGVTQAAIASNPPGLGASSRDIEIEDRVGADAKQRPRASLIVASPSYFSMIGMPLLVGRSFNQTDGEKGQEAAVVTRRFADTHWPGQLALGRRFRLFENEKPGAWLTVVGVCADIVQDPQPAAAPPLVYISSHQEAWGWTAVLLRTSADPASLAGSLRKAVQSLDPDLPLYDVRTLTAAVARAYWYVPVFGTLFSVFGACGLLMAAVGMYAVIAHATAQRNREIGIRIALGATAAAIIQLVLSRGLAQLMTGLAIGLTGAFAATHFLATTGAIVGDISPNDPFIFFGIAVLLTTIGVFACLLPARRATRVNPMVALRTE